MGDKKSVADPVEKIARLGLTPLHEEIRAILTGFQLLVLEERDANGGAAVRKMIDAEFEARVGTGWKKAQTGAVDWTKCCVIAPVHAPTDGKRDLGTGAL